MKTKKEKVQALLSAVDRHRLQQNGVPLWKTMKQEFKPSDKPKTDLDRKLDLAMYKLHQLQIRFYAENRIK
jgi:hypothetical protein